MTEKQATEPVFAHPPLTGETGFPEAGRSHKTEQVAGTSGSSGGRLAEDFAAAFQADPERAVDRLAEQVTKLPNGGLAAARVCLPYLVGASYAQQNLFLDALLRASSPEDVVSAALLLSQDSTGEAVLEAAAAVLEHFGARSWPALAKLAASGDPRCRSFVRAVEYVPAPSPHAKAEALMALALNPDLDTRWLAATVAEGVSSEAAAAVWRTLRTDSDDQLRTTAEAQLASLPG
jgi:hypothetical protein